MSTAAPEVTSVRAGLLALMLLLNLGNAAG